LGRGWLIAGAAATKAIRCPGFREVGNWLVRMLMAPIVDGRGIGVTVARPLSRPHTRIGPKKSKFCALFAFEGAFLGASGELQNRDVSH
jgi:hypothetical protein